MQGIKLNKLVSLLNEVVDVMGSVDDEVVVRYRESWRRYLKEITQVLGDTIASIETIRFIKNFEEHIMDALYEFNQSASVKAQNSFQALIVAVLKHYPEFFEHIKVGVRKVLVNNKISSDREYYLMRQYALELQYLPDIGNYALLEEVNRLLDEYLAEEVL